jgi:hypothetical protein
MTVTAHFVTGAAIEAMSTAWKSSLSRRVEAGDHIRSGRARRADTDADIAMLGTGKALGHVRRALDVAGKDMADRSPRLQGRVEWIDRGPRDAEGAVNPLLLQHVDGSVDSTHLDHDHSSLFR